MSVARDAYALFVTLAALYDINAHGLAKRVQAKFGGTYSVARTRFLIDVVFATYPKLERWRREEMAKADAGDDLTRTPIGRLRLLDVARRENGWHADRAARLNAPVQGAAADAFKYALALIWERRRDCPGDPRVVNLVHDEIVAEIDEDHALEGKGWLERCMTDGLAMALGGVSAGERRGGPTGTAAAVVSAPSARYPARRLPGGFPFCAGSTRPLNAPLTLYGAYLTVNKQKTSYAGTCSNR